MKRTYWFFSGAYIGHINKLLSLVTLLLFFSALLVTLPFSLYVGKNINLDKEHFMIHGIYLSHRFIILAKVWQEMIVGSFC